MWGKALRTKHSATREEAKGKAGLATGTIISGNNCLLLQELQGIAKVTSDTSCLDKNGVTS